MPADRLAELRRQRALLQENLAGLDRQIAEASAPAREPDAPALPDEPAAMPPVSSHTGPDPALPTIAPRSPELAADAILDEYRVTPDTVRSDLRKGCFLYFAAAFAVLILGVLVLYFALSRR